MQLFAQGRGHRTGVLFAVPNGEERTGLAAARLSGMTLKNRLRLPLEDLLMPAGQGLLPGAPDLILWGPKGRPAIEIKIPESDLHNAGTLSRMQKAVRLRCQQLGIDYRVIRSQEAFYDLCIECGVSLCVPRPWGPGVAAAAPASDAPGAQKPLREYRPRARALPGAPARR